MTQKTNITKGILAIISLAATIAMTAVLARYLSEGFTVLQQVYLRVFVALVIALLVFHKYIRWHVIFRLPAKEWALLAFRGITGYAVGVVLMSLAATLTTIANVTFITALPFVSLLGFVFLREKVTWWKLAFILGSLFGVTLLATNDIRDVWSWQPGDIIAVAATLGLALSYVSRRWHSNRLNNQEITALTFVFGAGSVFLLSMLFGEGGPSLDVGWYLWVVIIVGGALNVIKLFLGNYGFQQIDAVQADNLLTLKGVWGVMFGLWFFGEWPTWQGLVGGAIILLCAIGMNAFSRRPANREATPKKAVP